MITPAVHFHDGRKVLFTHMLHRIPHTCEAASLLVEGCKMIMENPRAQDVPY